jgi:hypothetical protein
MIESLEKTNVLVKENEDNTVTITKGFYPSHNNRRLSREREIVVSYFSEADLEKLREVQITPISRGKTGKIASCWDRYVAYLMKREKQK